MQKKRPTIQSLRARPEVFKPAQVEELEKDAIRLIQIQDEMNELRDEEGYTDYAGTRHPGVRDRLELALVGMNLFSGVELEDFSIYLTSGKAADRVDPVELLRLGVSDTIIKAATVEGKAWTAVTCRRKSTRP